MIYKFRLISDESENFFCDIEIKGSQTFYDLHFLIQYEAEWDSSHLATFFISDDSWQRGKEISLLDIRSDVLLMDKTKISKFLKKPKDKVLYVFDLLSDRAFYCQVESIREEDEEDGKKYPYCLCGAGEFPSQIFDTKRMARQQRDIFSEDDFDEDELLDIDGLDIGKEDENPL